MKLLLLIVCTWLCVYNVNATCDVSILDLVIVLDESGSIDRPSYELAKQAVYKMIENLNVGPKKVHVGLVRYSSNVESFFELIESTQNKVDLLRFISDMKQKNGGTATGDAIVEANRIFTNFGRKVTPKVAIVLTDGYSNSGLANVITASNLLKNSKVHLFAVGIGADTNDRELTDIASVPKEVYKKSVSDYNDLVSSINDITYVVCETNAIIEIGQKVSVQAGQNERRNFETEVNTPNKPKATYLEFVLANIKGTSVLSYSFLGATSTVNATSSRETVDENGLRVFYYDIKVPANAKLFYFTIKSLAIGDNEYDFEINDY